MQDVWTNANRLETRQRRSLGFPILVGLLALIAVVAALFATTYNRLVGLDQDVRAQWAQVENAYQRRADLVPNLVETVKGAAKFERETYTEVARARASVGQLSPAAVGKVLEDPAAFQRFQQAQDALGSALSRLIAVAEKYPDLKATENFRELQAQLEGTENRIAVERMRFNEAARDFNTARNRFPTVMVAGMFGARFQEKPYFQAQPGAQTRPDVRF